MSASEVQVWEGDGEQPYPVTFEEGYKQVYDLLTKKVGSVTIEGVEYDEIWNTEARSFIHDCMIESDHYRESVIRFLHTTTGEALDHLHIVDWIYLTDCTHSIYMKMKGLHQEGQRVVVTTMGNDNA